MNALFTVADKLKAIDRELALRRKVYPVRVQQKKMKPVQMTHEIAIMEAIREDYVRLCHPPSSRSASSNPTSGNDTTSASPPLPTSTKS